MTKVAPTINFCYSKDRKHHTPSPCGYSPPVSGGESVCFFMQCNKSFATPHRAATLPLSQEERVDACFMQCNKSFATPHRAATLPLRQGEYHEVGRGYE